MSHVFGLPGSQNARLFSALARTEIRTVLTGSELTGCFMANGFHRAGGTVPVVATIPGPGFTYALTGFAEAAQDNAAMVLLCGAPDERPGKRYTQQAIDQAGMVRGLARAHYRLERPEDAAAVAAAACRATLERGPGPVLLEVGPDVLGAPFLDTPGRVAPADPTVPDLAACDEISTRMRTARRVVIMAGQGAVAAAPLLRRLVDHRPAMVMTTVSARGVLPESHPWSLGHDFLACGIGETNRLLEKADFVLVLGCRTSHNGTGGFRLKLPEQRTAQVDLDPEVLGANFSPRWVVCGDVGRFLERLLTNLDDADAASDWTAHNAAAWRKTLRRKRTPNPPEPVFPGVKDGRADQFFADLQAALPHDAIVVTDTGQHQIMVREHLRVETPRGLIVPSDFQSMGFGLPAAIGAVLAAPERRIVAVVGDGGVMMTGLELATAVRERLDLTVIVFRDGYLGQIRSQQARSGDGEAAVRLASIDLAALAEATGARYVIVEKNARAVLQGACRSGGVTLVDVPLNESPAMRRERQLGSVRETTRRALGKGGTNLVRKILRRP